MVLRIRTQIWRSVRVPLTFTRSNGSAASSPPEGEQTPKPSSSEGSIRRLGSYLKIRRISTPLHVNDVKSAKKKVVWARGYGRPTKPVLRYIAQDLRGDNVSVPVNPSMVA